MQGLSLRPILEDEEQEGWRDAIYYRFFESGWGVPAHYGIRTDRYKLIRFYGDVDSWEFYDLHSDPLEMSNSHTDPVYQNTISKLRLQLDSLSTAYGDSLPDF